MPYVKPEIRERLDNWESPQTAGELNYVITKLLDAHISERIPSYELFNTVVGVLECVKLEMYRRIVTPYENQKLRENGEVYSKDLTEEKL